MASVPSAGCLLARNQFYRTRHNSTSSTSSSSSSCCDLLAEHERTPAPHGIHIPFEKCWWLKNFLHCENPQPAHPEIPSNSGSS
ncbi:pancreatic progenitor cell differentiation and proliferation factor-like protein [Polypterus senegalus]|uniref:pancreatic progenitor cell differentiation and proliferation factor-like protein n=1 Tax=Polypterus senegalus TaxID=55291 RepID=UPI0019660EF6|nr:pancreatic progenitor cell differentiation and proliferation factor-like protein [Polypterus senegalus]